MTSRAKHSAPHEPTAERFQPPPRTPLAYPDGKFPVFPPRGDMQNPIYLHLPGHMAALSRHFGSPDTTIVLGKVPVGWNVSRRLGLRIPDLIIDQRDRDQNQVRVLPLGQLRLVLEAVGSMASASAPGPG